VKSKALGQKETGRGEEAADPWPLPSASGFYSEPRALARAVLRTAESARATSGLPADRPRRRLEAAQMGTARLKPVGRVVAGRRTSVVHLTRTRMRRASDPEGAAHVFAFFSPTPSQEPRGVVI